MRSWKQRHWRNCKTCGRVLKKRGQVCGTLKSQGDEFPDGGWVSWRSWTPCSVDAPGGVHAPVPSVDPDEGDLDDVRGLGGGEIVTTVH
jgi:hypothetical protein